MGAQYSPQRTTTQVALASEDRNTTRVDGENGGIADSSVHEREGTWKHAAFHIATTIATPAAYAPLPFALASLGWPLGVSSLVSATIATWYSSLLIAALWKWNGKEYTTYGHLAKSIFGPWGYRFVAFFQQVASLGNNIAIQIAAGSSLKAVYKQYDPNGTLTLQHFIIFFGIFELFLSHLPDIHSLRWVNALSTFSTIGFAATVIGVTIYDGKSTDRSSISYSLQGSSSDKAFQAFNALGTIAFSFGDAILPEIQDTVREPAKKNMYKGVSAAYTVIVFTYWLVAFTGFWAFGSGVQSYILSSLTVPEWAIVMANIFAVIQISGCFQIYCRPTFALIEDRKSSNKAEKQADKHLQIGRILQYVAVRCTYMVIITTVSAATPFFGDFVAICGAIGFTPLDFVFPAIAFLKAGKMPKQAILRYFVTGLNIVIAVWFSVVAILGCIGSVKFIIRDVNTYKFFHNM